ncbi:MAG: hypothetical protein EOL88_15840, partial [Bacteroidia bacterium]|nr:hypothetical protein [Bacteroidia bacterium]
MNFNNLIVIFFLLTVFTGCTRTQETYYANGAKSSAITYRNGTPTGEATFWHPNGALMQKNTYENGMVSGRLTRWHPNGNKELEEEYEN